VATSHLSNVKSLARCRGAVRRQQIPHALVVHLQHTEHEGARLGLVTAGVQQLVQCAVVDAAVPLVALHRVRLARSRLAVRKHAHVVAVQNADHKGLHVFKRVGLSTSAAHVMQQCDDRMDKCSHTAIDKRRLT
jgi:hypothetical protein